MAGRARVPLGNVYYYFKTKESLAEAPELRHLEWTARHRDPRERLRRMIRAPLDGADSVVRFGCPHGSLCQELEKLGDDAPLARASTRLLKVYVDFATQQLREVGLGKRARPLATALVAQIQGAMLVAHTMRSRAVYAPPPTRLGVLAPNTGTPVGHHVPEAHGVDLHGKDVSLASLYAKGPILLAFYRGGWCPYCNTEIHSLTKAYAEYQKRGTRSTWRRSSTTPSSRR